MGPEYIRRCHHAKVSLIIVIVIEFRVSRVYFITAKDAPFEQSQPLFQFVSLRKCSLPVALNAYQANAIFEIGNIKC